MPHAWLAGDECLYNQIIDLIFELVDIVAQFGNVAV